MQKLIVLGQDQQRLECIKEELMSLSSFNDIQTVIAHKLGSLTRSNVQLLVLDVQAVNDMIFPFLDQIRKIGMEGPIIVLGSSRPDFDIDRLLSLDNVFQINKPYTENQIVGLCRNCLNEIQVKKRRNERFDVHEQAILETYSSDYKTETVINNISKSGACIQGELSGLKKGDFLRLHFNFDKINSERTMSARVVWVKKDNDSKEEAGLEFVSQKIVYQYLLKNAVA